MQSMQFWNKIARIVFAFSLDYNTRMNVNRNVMQIAGKQFPSICRVEKKKI